MRNFIRVLRLSMAYKGRILISFLCALIAALLWGTNFSAVYPVLELLGKEQNLQQWIDIKQERVELEIQIREKELEAIKKRQAEVEMMPAGPERDKAELDVTDSFKHVVGKLASARDRLWRYQQLKHYVIRHLPEGRFNTLALILGGIVLAVFIKGIFEFIQEYLVGLVTTRTAFDLRNQFFRQTIHQDLRQINEGGSAELMSRFTNDVEVIANGMKILYGRVVGEPLRALVCVAIAFWINWQLTLTFILVVPLALGVMTTASKKMKKASRRLLDRMGSIYKLLQETFRGVRVVKGFTMESYERRRFHETTKDYMKRSQRVIFIDAVTSPIVETIGVAAVMLALLAGAYLVLSGEKRIFGTNFTSQPLELGNLLWLYAQLIGMADPVRKLSSVYTKLQSAAAAADRCFTMMDRVPQVTQNPDGVVLPRHSKSIQFQNVCFSYTPEKQVLTNICFTVSAGETIGIVGANGSGKSTLLNLLPRFYDPDHGSIFIDGINIREANLRSVRKQLGIVTQEPILFDDTIYNNILYGRRNATLAEVEDAAKKAFAHDFIIKLPKGYQTPVGELGSSLSGGERQRVALARAILRDPRILILDEFSSAIDPASDALIHQALREFKKDRTTFFITHKMHTLDLADRIIVLDQHQLVAIGTYKELLESCEIFRDLINVQSQLRLAS